MESGGGMGRAVCPRCGGPLQQQAGHETAFCPHCTPQVGSDTDTKTCSESAPRSAAQDYRGRSFGNYTILEEVSRGAMGVVYKARQHHLDRVVALKVLLAGEMATEAQVVRFRREAQAAARLRHPAIVPIHEVGVHEGRHFYTMDFIKGRDLSDLIRSGEVTTRRALDIAAQVADALDYAHGRGVVHRDIKPSNIMIDAEDRVHIMDFGLAKQLDSDTKFTRTGTTIGTPAYMPPEQASGESARVDHRADIYSLGAVLYEMLTSRPPFSGDTMMNTLMKVLNDEPVPPKRLNPRIHRDIQTIVLKAMEKSVERRYPSMRAFADDIRRFIAGESISARPAGPLYRAWRFVRRHYAALFASAAVIGILATAAVVVLEARRDSEERARRAFEAGKVLGAQALERRIEQQEKPAVKAVFEDDFAKGPLDARWVAEDNAPWQLVEGGHLEVAAAPFAAIRTRARVAGKVAVTFEASVVANADGSAPPEPVIGCFLGTGWRHSCRFAVGGRAQPQARIVLMNQQQEVAESRCPPLRPGVWYRFSLRRDATGLRLDVEAEDEGQAPVSLAYNDVALVRHLHRDARDFAAGIFAERARVRVRRFQIEQEFLPAKLSVTDAAEVLYRDGNIGEARLQYEKIAQGHEGRYEGLAAMLGLAACHEAERRPKEALAVLRRLEALAPRVRHEQVPALLTRARLQRFFCAAALNDFSDAAQALAQLLASGAEVDPAWAWHFPGYIGQMISNRAYGEALATLRAGVFAPAQRRLHAVAAALQATSIEAALTPRIRQLADGFISLGKPERIREIYEAYPSDGLAEAFARAAEHWAQQGRHAEAMEALSFCAQQKLASPSLGKAAVELANALCAAGAHLQVAKLYEAVPEPKLAAAFIRAIRETTDAGRLDDAFALVRETLRNFPAEADKLVGTDGPAIRLAKAFVGKGDFLKTQAIHELFPEPPAGPPVLALFVAAAGASAEAGRAEEAARLLDYARVQFGVLQPDLAAVANRLVAAHAAAGAYDKVGEAYAAYPNETLAPAVAKAIAAAAAAGRRRDALALFGHYARRRQPIPQEAVRAVADSLAALRPDNEEREPLLAEYERVYELYESPAARSAFRLGLGDAYMRAGRWREALVQYEGSGDPEGLLRAASVAAELGEADRSTALWLKLRKTSTDDPPRSTAAAFMLRETSPSAFQQAAAAAGLAEPLVQYLTGLRLWLEADDAAQEELAKAAANLSAWFAPLAARPRSPDGARD